jgi:hypothetical protein
VSTEDSYRAMDGSAGIECDETLMTGSRQCESVVAARVRMTAQDALKGGMMSESLHRRSGWETRASLVCTLCARTVGSVHGPAGFTLTAVSIRVPDASHADAVRRLRCPHCLGRLWLQDREEIYVERCASSAEVRGPSLGRRRRLSRAS